MPVPTLHHQQISDSDVGHRTAIFVEAACRCLKTHSLEHGLRAGERKDFRGTLDSDCLVHSLSLLLINVRLWANLVTSLGIYNAGVMAAHLGRLNEIIQGQSKHSMHVSCSYHDGKLQASESKGLLVKRVRPSPHLY